MRNLVSLIGMIAFIALAFALTSPFTSASNQDLYPWYSAGNGLGLLCAQESANNSGTSGACGGLSVGTYNTVNEQYFAHKDNSIETIFKDNQGNSFDLQEYLQYLTDKVTTLENIIYSAKGMLKVSIFNGIDEVEIKNNSSINIDVFCQNYGTTTDGNTYDNKLYIIKDYYLKLQNLSVSSVLSFLVKDTSFSNLTIPISCNNALMPNFSRLL